MTLPTHINDRVTQSYRDVSPGLTSVAVTIEGSVTLSYETKHYNGTVSGTPVSIPTVAAGLLTQILVRCLTGTITVSFDGGSTFITVKTDEVLTFEPQALTQFSVSGTGTYQSLFNRVV